MSDVDNIGKTETKPKTKRPRLYKVILVNDDFTPREFVVGVLMAVFRMTEDQSYRVMMTAHRRGVCVVAVFTRDVAESKATEATELGRRAGHPLMFTTEPEEQGGSSSTMTYEEFNAYCASLPATTYVMQWGGSHVWKVGGKVFAIGGLNRDEGVPAYTFKVSGLSFEILQEQAGLRPAPYLASRGLKWIQHFQAPGLDDAALRDYLAESHRIVALGLTKTKRRELGLDSA